MPQSGRIKELLLEPRGDFGSLSGTKRTSIWCQHRPVRRNRTLSSQLARHVRRRRALLSTRGSSASAGRCRAAAFPGSGTATQPLLGQEGAKEILGRKDVENGAGDEPLWSPSLLRHSWSCGLTRPAGCPAFQHHVLPTLSCDTSCLVPCCLAHCNPGTQKVWDYFIQHWQK